MRLIDADSLADALFEKGKNYPQWVADTIGNMSDAIVRCKDCKHWFCTNNGNHRCEILNKGQPNADWFCADGERRTE